MRFLVFFVCAVAAPAWATHGGDPVPSSSKVAPDLVKSLTSQVQKLFENGDKAILRGLVDQSLTIPALREPTATKSLRDYATMLVCQGTRDADIVGEAKVDWRKISDRIKIQLLSDAKPFLDKRVAEGRILSGILSLRYPPKAARGLLKRIDDLRVLAAHYQVRADATVRNEFVALREELDESLSEQTRSDGLFRYEGIELAKGGATYLRFRGLRSITLFEVTRDGGFRMAATTGVPMSADNVDLLDGGVSRAALACEYGKRMNELPTDEAWWTANPSGHCVWTAQGGRQCLLNPIYGTGVGEKFDVTTTITPETQPMPR